MLHLTTVHTPGTFDVLYGKISIFLRAENYKDEILTDHWGRIIIPLTLWGLNNNDNHSQCIL